MAPGLFRRVSDGVKLTDLVVVNELEPFAFGAPLRRCAPRGKASDA
jgi:hypothetical protein